MAFILHNNRNRQTYRTWLRFILEFQKTNLLLLYSLIFCKLCFTSVSGYCPGGCQCNEPTLTVRCNATGLDVVPIMLNPSLRELDLSNNRLKHVYSSLNVYHELRQLSISHNQIIDLGKKSFSAQRKLKSLHLHHNNITTITSNTFQGLASLQILHLGHNQLEELVSRTFLGLNRLEILDLGHNQIQYIQPEAFFGLLNLKQLSLYGNHLKLVPSHAFLSLQSLIQLNLGHNQIGTLSDSAFGTLGTLRELSLEHNRLSLITAGSFRQLSNLTALDLGSNHLHSVPTPALSALFSLQTLILSRNLIHSLGPRALAGAEKLQQLHLSSLSLRAIHPDALLDNVHLRNLFLENNHQLQHIPGGFLRRQNVLKHFSLKSSRISTLEKGLFNVNTLETLDIAGNPLNCNCSLNWIADYYRAQIANGSHSSGPSEARCVFPALLSGKPLYFLTSRDLACPSESSSLILALNLIALGAVAAVILFLFALCIGRRLRHRQTSKCALNIDRSDSFTTPPQSTLGRCPPVINQNATTAPLVPHPLLSLSGHKAPHSTTLGPVKRLSEDLYYYPAEKLLDNNSTLDCSQRNHQIFQSHAQFQQQQQQTKLNYQQNTLGRGPLYQTLRSNSTMTRSSAMSVDLHPIPNHYSRVDEL